MPNCSQSGLHAVGWHAVKDTSYTFVAYRKLACRVWNAVDFASFGAQDCRGAVCLDRFCIEEVHSIYCLPFLCVKVSGCCCRRLRNVHV